MRLITDIIKDSYALAIKFLMILLLILGQGFSQDCSPFGTRISLGEAYTRQPTKNVQFYIVFNTPSLCSSSVLKVETAEIACKIDTIVIDNAGFGVSYSFSAFVHICPVEKLGTINSQGLYAFNYEINGQKYSASVPAHNLMPQKWLVLGDWGLVKTKSADYEDLLMCMSAELTIKEYAGIIFVGDIAYDLETNNCAVYNQFLRGAEMVLSKLPFMVAVGNHEYIVRRKISGTLFGRSFIMPLNDDNRNDFYSFDVGGVHFVSFNPYYDAYGLNSAKTYPQALANLTKQFEAISKVSYSWIVPFSHYPLFCSYASPVDRYCSTTTANFGQFRSLLNKYNIKLYLSGHVHTYQRQKPMTDSAQVAGYQTELKIQDGIRSEYIKNTKGFLGIVQGDAGNDEYLQTSLFALTDKTAKLGVNTGYGILTFFDGGLLKYQRKRAGRTSLLCYTEDFIYLQQKPNLLWIIGVVLGSVIFIVVVAGIAYYCINKHRSTSQPVMTEGTLEDGRSLQVKPQETAPPSQRES